MSFEVKDDDILIKYNKIWNKMLNANFHSKPLYDEKYMKAVVKTFNGVVNTMFWSKKL